MPLASKQSQCFLSVVRITEREASKVPQVNINVLSISNCRDAMDRQQQLMRRGQYIRKISIDAPACLSCRHTDTQTDRHEDTWARVKASVHVVRQVCLGLFVRLSFCLSRHHIANICVYRPGLILDLIPTVLFMWVEQYYSHQCSFHITKTNPYYSPILCKLEASYSTQSL